jgi:hypothetical protein
LANMPSSSPLRTEQRQKGGGGPRRKAGRWGCPPATLATAAAGRWGKTERRPRGIDSRAHLVLGWSEEAAPRDGSGSAAVLGGGGVVEFGEEGRRRGEAVLVWCGEPGRPSAPFIGGERRFRVEIFLRRAPLRRARGASRGGDPATRQLGWLRSTLRSAG